MPEAKPLKLMELKSVTTTLWSLDPTHCFKSKSPKTIRTVTELLSWKLRLLKHQLQLGNLITSLSFRNTPKAIAVTTFSVFKLSKARALAVFACEKISFYPQGLFIVNVQDKNNLCFLGSQNSRTQQSWITRPIIVWVWMCMCAGFPSSPCSISLPLPITFFLSTAPVDSSDD